MAPTDSKTLYIEAVKYHDINDLGNLRGRIDQRIHKLKQDKKDLDSDDEAAELQANEKEQHRLQALLNVVELKIMVLTAEQDGSDETFVKHRKEEFEEANAKFQLINKGEAVADEDEEDMEDARGKKA